jgi:cytidylate kinase
MKKPSLVVTVDGTAGSGKSTIARKFAIRCDALYINSGLLYRSIAYRALQEEVEQEDGQPLRDIIAAMEWDLCRTDRGGSVLLVDGKLPITALTSESIAEVASKLATLSVVRDKCTAFQREQIARHPRIVVEGRDGGTVVFPRALVKWYVDAPLSIRSHRRYSKLRSMKLIGESPADELRYCDEIAAQLIARDTRDQQRGLAPQCPADDAIHIDTSIEKQSEILSRMEAVARERLKVKSGRT